MKNIKLIAIAFLFSFQLASAQKNNLTETINKAADKIEQKVIDWRHDFHEHPELENREFRTAEIIAKHLKSLGIEVQANIAKTGVVGILKGDKPGPVVALRADMDGLPVIENNDLPYKSNVTTQYNGKETGVMHACGGGNRSNIISEQVEMMGTVRTLSNSDQKLVFDRVRQITEKTAEAAGATATLELPYSTNYPVTFNNVALTSAMLPSLQKAAGVENVLLVPAVMGAEDFSFFAQKVPGLFFFLGGLPKGKDPKTAGAHHTPQFIIDDSSFKIGVKAFCNLVFDYMEMNKK